MPLALLAAMPPIMAELIEAGSGPILRPYGASRRLACAPTTPGCSRMRRPSSRISQRLQPSPATTRIEPVGRAQDAGDLGLVGRADHDLRVEPIEARVGAVSEGVQRVGEQALRRDEGADVGQKALVAFGEHG